MEFFEKAHVVKNKTSGKSDEKVKKQLRQMLYGYKQSDNDIIRASADVTGAIEESSSVSGYSDLDITVSSNESSKGAGKDVLDFVQPHASADVYQQNSSIVNSPTSSSVSGFSDLDLTSSSIEENIPLDTDMENLTFSTKHQIKKNIKDISIFVQSECELNSNQSPSEDEQFSTTEDDLDIEETCSKTSSIASSSEFDANGELAKKIMKKLSKKNKLGKSICAKAKKYKLNSCNVKHIPSKEKSDCEISTDHTDSLSKSSESNDSIKSSPFVSITVTDMAEESLSQIVGEYKNPTIRNLPFESNNISLDLNDSEFTARCATVDNMQVEDCSLADESYDSVPDIEDTNQSCDNTSIDIQNVDSTLYNSLENSPSETEVIDEMESTESIDTKDTNNIRLFYGKKSCVLVMKHPSAVYFHGKIQVHLLGGSAEVFGFNLDDKAHYMFAPNYSYAQCIRTTESSKTSSGLFRKLTSFGVSVLDAEDIVTHLNEHDAVISLSSFKSNSMDFIEDSLPSVDFFSKTSKHVDSFFSRASNWLGCSLYLSPHFKYFELTESWKKAISCGLSNPKSRGIVCGIKNAGKSTFVRYYVNQLLSNGPVLVIDLDPGQAEFMVAGNVSATVVDSPLIGPNYTHLTTPVRTLNMGMINTMANQRLYVNTVSELLDFCSNDEKLRNMPWIVNTMGMCNGLGVEFMKLIITLTWPTFVLQFNSNNEKKNFKCHFDAQTINKECILRHYLNYTFILAHQSERTTKSYSLSPRDERYLNFLAYFGTLSVNRTGILHITPYQVPLRSLNVGVNGKVNDSDIAKVINGKIVALCECSTADGGKLFTLQDKPLLCHGQGLVRGINLETYMLYVLTPLKLNKLALVNTIVYADWVPELRGQEKHLPKGLPVPYRTDSVYQQKQLMFAPRRRFNPLQLLKMTRNT